MRHDPIQHRAAMAIAACVVAMIGNSLSEAQEMVPAARDKAPGADVAAFVGEVPILVADVELTVRQSLGGRTATAEAQALLQAAALQQLIEQQKALVQLQRRGEACTPQELEREVLRLQADLARQEKTLDDYCRSLQIPDSSLRRLLQWNLSWQRCRERNLTEENLQRHFERHRREFDGTTLRAAQILWLAKDAGESSQLVPRAAEVRAEILSGKVSFADAARKYSQSPSGREGGELGWISRHEPMPEFFSRAAFQLEVGEISPPVESPYGVHLIQCLEIQPGQKTWTQVRERVEQAAAEYLFHWLADQADAEQEVRYTGRVPHFLPGTRQLAQ